MEEKSKHLSAITFQKEVYYMLLCFFLLTFGYFVWLGNYVLFFQEQQSLFVFSYDFIHPYLLKPGGILELTGKFLTQFYASTFVGAFLVAVSITLPGWLLLQINRRLNAHSLFSNLFLLIPSILLLLMQTHYFHLMEFNIGFLLVLLFFLFTTAPQKKNYRYLALILFPVYYYCAGAYVLLFPIMYTIYILLFERNKQGLIYIFTLLSVVFLTIFLFKTVLFLQPFDLLLKYPLPFVSDVRHKIFLYILTLFLAFYPLEIKATAYLKVKKVKPQTLFYFIGIFFVTLTIGLLSKQYNNQTANVLKIEKLVFAGKYKEAISYQETYPTKNLIGQYFYNYALSETNQLCDHLFYGRQDFGANSLILPWEKEYINWGAYFFYSVGLVNEAQRWAYEEMVIYGYRPENLKMLAKTNIINGNYARAGKYISILRKTFHYHQWAREYEKLLKHPELIPTHEEIGKKRKILPQKDFFIEINAPQNNIPKLLASDPENKIAFEYEMAWLLLNKNVEEVVRQITKMETMGYKTIPKHIEEAALVYFNGTGKFPDLGGLSIRQETTNAFNNYVTAFRMMRQNPSAGKEKMQKRFGNTYMYYFHFK